MSNHFIVKCKSCDGVVSQCRCPAPNKTIQYSICDKCKSMEKLSAEQIDKELTDNDTRKPVRKIVDDAVIPAASVLAGGVIGTVNALGNIKTNQRLHKVD